MKRVTFTTFLQRLLCGGKSENRGVSRSQAGAGAVTAVGFLGACIAVVAFAVDSTRMTSDSAQLKHATDAAAMAVAQAYAKDPTTNVNEMAERYIKANLGMDSSQLGKDMEISVTPMTWEEYDGFRVTAVFKAKPVAMGGQTTPVEVSSAAVAVYNPLEIALVLPNTSAEDAGELAVLRRLSKEFASKLIEDRPDRWMALVPYSQTVNVYDRKNTNRIREWAESAALKPVELTSLFMRNSYGISNLASRRMPDLQKELLAVYRGLNIGDNYFWTKPPAASFKVHYRHDLPINAPQMPYIQWTGPNPDFGEATGTSDTRYIVADKGCPAAPLLPLTNDMNAIITRLGEMKSQFNVNYAIAMGWGAMALSPAFRGSGGWGDLEHPLDFSSKTNTNIKAIVMLANTMGNWFDSDAYNFYVGQSSASESSSQSGSTDPDDTSTGDPTDEGNTEAKVYGPVAKRFKSLCQSFRQKDILFYFIGVRPGDPEDYGRAIFGKHGYPGLLYCESSSGDVGFVNADSFASGEGYIRERLEKIAASLENKSSFARLVE
ncbi:hypothetical protein [Desulfovibrio intestinalis]|uniref:Flp pilus assembly protein TadG n=1 Tax=Desulfovibrio intestinalis TaxID=58621 RepID=A0A7W8FET1_9BACT|nr:hypothetical protein [Desulfovibrio intestinalis]MBB5142131.1 Flp pilus assembly protein TadG [Desulfovibrio intestinalis]